jgi:hypothetical protein
METFIKKPSLKSAINNIVRRTQRVAVNTVTKNVTVQREIYANKEIITVFANIDLRFMGRI